ncbi:kynureninase [Pseudoroseicyclus tamaricis]|uniref:Kynureninase n=1 Tax=Pseudoroseicyclus tamaricis TaxID=2705421 RepID=A0A6B2JKG3_9RHOB|nr:kynureninase [Pseudoroseicyclus tamaricis]NDV01963.1 kynureninase [Pseudoroseicyclus tamaricis]
MIPKRDAFLLPEGQAYLDGNSLGPLPAAAPARMEEVMRSEWGEMAVTGWNRAGWMALPETLGNRIAPLIGAGPGEVIVGETLSIRLWQALAAALQLTDRKVVLTDSGNFPSDLYMAEGLLQQLGQGHELRVVAPEEVAGALTEEVGVLMLTEVDYRIGRRHDMAALTAAAHDTGALALWDLAHSAGAVDVDLRGCGADFAVGCTYKYLNGGPGAPAFLWAAPRHHGALHNALPGWLGHAAPFDFELEHRPAPGIRGMRVGTPSILAMAALDAAMDAWEGVDMAEIRAASLRLSERFIAGVEAACPDLTLASPRDPGQRGSQVSFRHPESYAICQALIARGVVGDFRAPDLVRFGITPLYIDEAEIDRAIAALAEVMQGRLWDDSAYATRAAVT